MKKITSDDINRFLMGHDPMEHIISIECTYMDDTVFIIYRAEDGTKRVKLDDFKPFLWAKNSVCIRMFDGKRGTLKRKLNSYGIGVKALTVSNNPADEVPERLANGYKYLFYAKRKMSYAQFNRFFDEAGTPIYEKKKKPDDKISSREFLSVPPVEQYMIASGKRLFKGYDNYDDLVRLQFDIETQGLNPRIHALDQIGIRTNKGYEKIITITGEGEERKRNELKAMDEFLSILAELKPDVIAGHNSENFDWDFFFVRAKVLGSDFSEMSLKYFKHAIFKKKKEAVLKLGGEVEYYHPTIMWGHSIIDSLHAARRAQAIDSNMKSSNLKYVTQYLKLKKENRVYVPGNDITTVWNEQDEHSYAFNNNDGSWYKITEEKPLREGYEYTSGKYIVERYLLDDIWETDKIELKLNESNFLVGKMIPTTFARACTMGTAAIWKLIMLAWSYENDLAIPATAPNKKFTGGLSRLLKTGYVDRIVKLDYNSLYPSVILTWNISTPLDILNAMLAMLNYILTEREKYKELKADAGEKCDEIEEKIKLLKPDAGEKTELKHELTYWKSEKMANDKKQLPLKIFANSFFGSLGCPAIFPWGTLDAAEMTTCISRQLLRLMISHFKELGYEPIVGDSFTGDTPLLIKYNDSELIDIKPIEELIGETETDALGREYDTSEKPYKVLCRSGWVTPEYIYRHKTDKPLYEVSEGNMSVTVTEDHSLFNDKQEKIKPSQINKETELEYYTDTTQEREVVLSSKQVITSAKMLKNGFLNRVPTSILNANAECKNIFLQELGDWDYSHCSKTCRAGVEFLRK